MRGPSVGKPTHVHVKGPLARYAVHFEEDLAEQGYRSARDQLYAMAQLSRWLASENLGAEDLTAAGVEQFLCWRRAVGYVSSLSLNKMSPLLHYLQGTGVVPTFEPITPMTPVGLLIERYSVLPGRRTQPFGTEHSQLHRCRPGLPVVAVDEQ